MELKFSQPKKKWRKGGASLPADLCWLIILSLAFVVVATGLVLGVLLFMDVNTKFVISPEDAFVKQKPINKERLDAALEYFAKKEQKTEAILNAPASPVVDPSR